ncbi:MAG TPA: MoxR family ATPase [Thermoanaerobaculia bacterium]|nr:MoxR family ATPase [Thermoanaerobaculia bacterium]
MTYRHLFDPKTAPPLPALSSSAAGDRRDGHVYVYTDPIVLAVNVALATGRPLLVRGPSGCGKSTLAKHAARVLGWRYYEGVITSRTQAQDLLWEIDHLRRLQDAQAKDLRGLAHYLQPGPLWWAFDREAAAAYGRPDPNQNPDAKQDRAVVLLDEIDKADPDVPNSLLVPLGSLEFQVPERDEPVRAQKGRAPLVVLTTNDERELPAAFLRRCVELVLQPSDPDRLVEIGQQHFPKASDSFLREVAKLVLQAAGNDGQPSPAEYLDAVRACRELEIEPGSALWESLATIALWKHGRTRRAGE